MISRKKKKEKKRKRNRYYITAWKSRYFGKNFVKATHLPNKSLKSDLTEKNSVGVNFSFFHSVSVEKREIFFREISSVVTSLVKALVSRNFCQKMRESKLPKFPQRLYLK